MFHISVIRYHFDTIFILVGLGNNYFGFKICSLCCIPYCTNMVFIVTGCAPSEDVMFKTHFHKTLCQKDSNNKNHKISKVQFKFNDVKLNLKKKSPNLISYLKIF